MKSNRPQIVLLFLILLITACTTAEEPPPPQPTEIPPNESPTDIPPTPEPEPTLEPTPEPEPETEYEAIITSTSQMTPIDAAIHMGYHLNWSPDGEWIAYTANDGDVYGIGLVNMLNGEYYLLNTELEGDLYNSWSADSSRLVVDLRINDGPLQLAEITLPEDLNDQVEPIPLPIQGFSMSPSFAPVGDQLVHSSNQGLKIYDFETQRSASIPNTQGCWHPQWSPVGDRVLFTCETSNGADIFSSALDGSDRQQVTDQQGRADRGAWSPDGEWIVFVSDVTGARQLWLVSTITGEYVQLTDLPTNADTWLYPSMPIFSPDGSQIAIVYDDAIWLIEFDL